MIEHMRNGPRSRTLLPLLVAMATGAAGTTAAGQALPPAAPELDALEWLVGEWEGSGWIEQVPSVRNEFRGTEIVERRVGGRLVVVEGSFTAWLGPDLGEQPVHQALGIFSYDAEAERLVFRTHTARGPGGEARVEVRGDGAIVWGFDGPSDGEVRYVIARTPAGEWHEIGERSADGETWTRFFEMTLRRRQLTPARTP